MSDILNEEIMESEDGRIVHVDLSQEGDLSIPEEIKERPPIVKYGYIIGGNLNLREEPSKDSKVIDILPLGAVISYNESSTDGWLKVGDGNEKLIGYVMAEYVKEMEKEDGIE